jgi:GH25 family lysozyme M1 (1,4-beta-N-acetylmuramidase)
MMQTRNYLKYFIHRAHAWFSVPQATLIGLKQRAYGVDMSRYQGTFNPDAAVPGLLDFAIIKATEGTTYKDPEFENFYPGISKLTAQGAYHYLKSGLSSASQANWFLDTIAGKKFHMLVIDFEGYGNVMDDAFVRVLFDVLSRVSMARPEAKTILYTNPNIYNTIIYPAAIRIWGRDVFADWDLFIAQYPFIVNVDGEPVTPKSRPVWKLWQFSAAGLAAEHGTKYPADRDVFNGGVSAFKSWLHITDPVPPPTPALPDMQVVLGDDVTYIKQTIILKAKQ